MALSNSYNKLPYSKIFPRILIIGNSPRQKLIHCIVGILLDDSIIHLSEFAFIAFFLSCSDVIVYFDGNDVIRDGVKRIIEINVVVIGQVPILLVIISIWTVIIAIGIN